MTVQTVSPSTTSRGHRTSSLTILAGVLFLVVPLMVEFVTGDAFLLMGAALTLLLLALPGLRRLQRGRDGQLGRWGLRLTIVGMLVMVALILSGDLLDAALSGSAQAVAEGVWLTVAAAAALGALVGVVSFSMG